MKIEIEKEDDGRWIAETPELPGVISSLRENGYEILCVDLLCGGRFCLA
jgi:predicted RNase H-like HicB family nuclease